MALFETVAEAFDAIREAIPEVARDVAWTGRRRNADGSVRQLSMPVRCIAREGAAQDIYADAVAPSGEHSWTLRIHVDDWLDATAPQVDDEVRFAPYNAAVETFRVSDVASNQQVGYWTVVVRTRETRR